MMRTINITCNLKNSSTDIVGWTAQPEAGFGNEQGQSVKYKMVNLISAVRTLMRSKFTRCYMQ